MPALTGKKWPCIKPFNYRLVGAMIPSNRATDLFEYGFEDNYDEKHMSIMVFIAAI